jgi:hypothetical protein
MTCIGAFSSNHRINFGAFFVKPGKSNVFDGSCWHLFGAPITQQEPAAVLSGQARTVRGTGPDGPRPGARLGFPA